MRKQAFRRDEPLPQIFVEFATIRDRAYEGRIQVFLHDGRLTQQYVVYAYIKIESNRIKYVPLNQNRLRAKEYVGLADYLQLHHREEAEEDFHVAWWFYLLHSWADLAHINSVFKTPWP
ncbi:hypothetical protein ILUMI_01003 [Ignelater luminosus]|uniref:Uncharacterized protein n=1 Tax=Ignelater luminosus TaxID=2038154 RepID=A0A8K0GMM0_IGNLU|nr:hypothetical protein ILUMI_01003 [Ignelater luminosus]